MQCAQYVALSLLGGLLVVGCFNNNPGDDPGLMCAYAALVGLGCLEGSMGCCTPFCMYPDGACPNPDQQCVQYFDPIDLPADDPWLDIGFCGVPG